MPREIPRNSEIKSQSEMAADYILNEFEQINNIKSKENPGMVYRIISVLESLGAIGVSVSTLYSYVEGTSNIQETSHARRTYVQSFYWSLDNG